METRIGTHTFRRKHKCVLAIPRLNNICAILGVSSFSIRTQNPKPRLSMRKKLHTSRLQKTQDISNDNSLEYITEDLIEHKPNLSTRHTRVCYVAKTKLGGEV